MRLHRNNEQKVVKLTTQLKNVIANIKTHQQLLVKTQAVSEIRLYKERLRQLREQQKRILTKLDELNQIPLPGM